MTIKPTFKVALPGKNIESGDPKDFSLHSDYNSIKIFKKGNGTISVGATASASVTITHNAGFCPMCIVFFELPVNSGKWYIAPFTTVVDNILVSGSTDGTYADTNSLVFSLYNADASSKNIKYYYFILGHSGV